MYCCSIDQDLEASVIPTIFHFSELVVREPMTTTHMEGVKELVVKYARSTQHNSQNLVI